MLTGFKLPPLPPALHAKLEGLRASYGRLQDWFAQVPLQLLIGLHFVLSGFGAAGAFFALRYGLENRYAAEIGRKAMDATKFFDWLRPYHFPEHRYSIYAYVAAAAMLGGLFLIGLLIQLRARSERVAARWTFPWIYFVDLALALWLLGLAPQGASVSLAQASILIAVWLGVVAVPFVPALIDVSQRRKAATITHPAVLIGIFALEFLFILSPFLTGRAVFFNDILELPSATWIKPNPTDTPRLVDNFQFINQNQVWGNHLRYDARVNPGEDPPCLPGASVKLPHTPFLLGFVEKYDRKYYLRHPTGELCFIGFMAEAEWRDLRSAFPQQTAALDETYGRSNRLATKWKRNGQPPEQVDFVARNQVEIVQGIHQLEAIFHHHLQILNPMKEYDMGRPLGEIVALYGLSFLPVYFAAKLLGPLSYGHALTVVFASYAVYFAAFVLVIQALVRDVRLTAFAFLSSLGFIKLLGYITVFVGLGYAPLRHFMDIFIPLALFAYLRSDRRGWLLGALVLTVGGILLDRVQGSFAAVALLALLAVRQFTGHARFRVFELAALVGGGAAIAAAFWGAGAAVAANPYAEGFLEGVWGFPVDNTLIAALFGGLVVAYGLIGYHLVHRFEQKHYLSLYLIFYVQLVAIYWVIMPNYGHLYAILPMFLLTAVVLYRYGLAPLLPERVERPLLGIALVAAVALSLFGTRHYMKTWATMSTVAEDHQVFDWPFEAARLRSTIDPAPLADASALIQKWVPGQSVYIVSQFDAPILWLARRYSAMPHFELSSFLNSQKALNRAVDALRDAKPDILVVDSCIRCSPLTLLPGRPLPSLDPAYYERLNEKVDRLKHLREVFAEVEADYELVERGMLVSVYRRKHP